MLKYILVMLLGALALGTLDSCESSTSATSQDTTQKKDTLATNTDTVWHRVLFVLSEGAFGHQNSSLEAVEFNRVRVRHDSGSVHDTTYRMDTVLHKDVLTGLGEGNDILVHGDRVYVLDNTSNAIQVVDARSYARVASIPMGLDQPNKMAVIADNKLMVTRRGVNSVAIVDLSSNTVTGSVDIGEPSVAVGVLNNRAFVTSGGFGTPGHLNVIDLSTMKVVSQAPLLTGPETLVVDSADAQVVIASTGDYATVGPRIYFASGTSGVLRDSLNAGSITDGIGLIGGQKLFVIQGGKVLTLNGAEHAIASTVLNTNLSIYQGYYDALTGDLYVGQTDFTSPSSVSVFSGTTGALEWSFPAGIAPAHFAFYH